jgi:CRP-like cAMP-binding protein
VKSFLERVLLLKRSPLFREVPTDDLRVVASQLKEVACFAGERVFDIGDPSDQTYIVLSGRIGISLDEDPRVRRFIRMIGPGECFGEMGVLENLPRSGTAHVVEDTLLLVLEEEKLRALVMSYPGLAFGLLRSLSMRLRTARETNDVPGPEEPAREGE